MIRSIFLSFILAAIPPLLPHTIHILADQDPSPTEKWLSIGGGYTLAGAIIWFLLTKHVPRQQEWVEKVVKDCQDTIRSMGESHRRTLEAIAEAFEEEQKVTRREHLEENARQRTALLGVMQTHQAQEYMKREAGQG